MASNEAVFDAVWDYVERSYYDSGFGGASWIEIGEKFRSQLSEVETAEELRDHLRGMLNELGESHFSILSADRSGSDSSKAWMGGDAGLSVFWENDSMALYRVRHDGPAWRAGLRDGDRIVEVNGKTPESALLSVRESGLPEYLVGFNAVHRLSSEFFGRSEERVNVKYLNPENELHESEFALESYAGKMVPPFGNFGNAPISFQSNVSTDGVGYLQFGLWFPVVMPEIRAFIASLDADSPGLILDLRGNPGGVGIMSGGVAGMLSSEVIVLGTTQLREGHINFVGYPQKNAFLGPVAILVDALSCSTSEIFACGMQEAGRARVFGQRTPGAALPSVVTKLPNGDLLQSVLGDFKTESGKTLERIGVIPDESIELSLPLLANGHDSVIEAARNWILNR